jgi:hypothetical protein
LKQKIRPSIFSLGYQMVRQRDEPRISVNKLAQYVTSRATRQNQILRTAKFPPEYITTYYREASEAIARFLAGGMIDFAILDNSITALSQKVAGNIYETRRIAGNIDAIETFSGLLDDIDFGTATAKLGAQKAPHLILKGVEISVRPEVTLHSTSKGGEDFVGGIKLHFPKTEPMDEEQASLVSSLINAFCKDNLWKDGAPLPTQCMVIDLASGRVYPGVKSIKQRLKEVESACGQIASLWPGITQ